jgi:hypothetical protein
MGGPPHRTGGVYALTTLNAPYQLQLWILPGTIRLQPIDDAIRGVGSRRSSARLVEARLK